MSADPLALVEETLASVRARIATLTSEVASLERLVAKIRAGTGTADSARQEAARPAPVLPRCEDCGGPRSATSGRRCKECYRASLRKAAVPETPTCKECGEPRSPGSAGRCRECYLAGTAARRPIALLPEPEPPQRPEPRPVLARQSREIDRGRPIDPRRIKPRAPPAAPDFPPEFLEKLRRVGEGAQIVEVRPISTREEGDGMFGSSLDF